MPIRIDWSTPVSMKRIGFQSLASSPQTLFSLLYAQIDTWMIWPAAIGISEIVSPVAVTIGFESGSTSSLAASRVRWYTIGWYLRVSYMVTQVNQCRLHFKQINGKDKP